VPESRTAFFPSIAPSRRITLIEMAPVAPEVSGPDVHGHRILRSEDGYIATARHFTANAKNLQGHHEGWQN